MTQEISNELLSILVCPDCKAPLVHVDDWLYSTDAKSRRRYPIRDGIPILIIEESEVVEPAEFDRVMALRSGDGANQTRGSEA